MCHLLKDTHHEFEFVFGNDNGLGDLRLLPFCLRTPSRGSRAGSRQSTLRTRSFSARFFVVLVKPLLISLVHVICEAAGDAIDDALIRGLRSTDEGNRILPPIRRIYVVIICNNARRVGCRNKSCRWWLQGLVRQSSRNVCAMGGRKDFLQVMFLEQD